MADLSLGQAPTVVSRIGASWSWALGADDLCESTPRINAVVTP